MVSKLNTAWEKIGLIARGKAKKVDKEVWEPKLDRLLDLTVCQCKIVLCDNPSKGCVKGTNECMGHITCDCPKELKLPVLELKWLFYQREKKGEKSLLGMVSADWS